MIDDDTLRLDPVGDHHVGQQPRVGLAAVEETAEPLAVDRVAHVGHHHRAGLLRLGHPLGHVSGLRLSGLFDHALEGAVPKGGVAGFPGSDVRRPLGQLLGRLGLGGAGDGLGLDLGLAHGDPPERNLPNVSVSHVVTHSTPT